MVTPDTQHIAHGEEVLQIIHLAQRINEKKESEDFLSGLSHEIADAVKEVLHFMRNYSTAVIGETVLQTAKNLMTFGVFENQDIAALPKTIH